MPNDFYIVASASRGPLHYADNAASAEARLIAIQAEYPDAQIISSDAYWERSKQTTLLRFPLSRITEEFYEDMLGVLPPVYRRGHAGFFISEAATQSVHAQFLSYKGRYYGGYADISPGGRCWTHDDIDAFEARADAHTPTLSWYPPDPA